MRSILQQSWPVLPVVNLQDEQQAVHVAAALQAAGFNSLEITLRHTGAIYSLQRIKQEFPQLTLGAGTVLSSEQAIAAAQAGADFLVSPGLSTSILTAVKKLQLPWLPGVQTASEAMQAMAYGLDCLKFFPAAGNLEQLKQLQGPFPELLFCPTGGIDASNLADFLACSNVVCCAGSWLVEPRYIAEQNWSAITQQGRELLRQFSRAPKDD